MSNSAVSVFSLQNINGVGMKFTNSDNTGVINYSIINIVSHGMELVSGNRDIDLVSGYINTAGGDGTKLTATSDSINLSSISVLNCTGYGFNIANANCDNNILVGNSTSNNTAGAINDSGTGTLKSALVNNFS